MKHCKTFRNTEPNSFRPKIDVLDYFFAFNPTVHRDREPFSQAVPTQVLSHPALHKKMQSSRRAGTPCLETLGRLPVMLVQQ